MSVINLAFSTWLDLSLIAPNCVKLGSAYPRIYLKNNQIVLIWNIINSSGIPKGVFAYIVKSDKSHCAYYTAGIDLINDRSYGLFYDELDDNLNGLIAIGNPFNSGAQTNGFFGYKLPVNYFIPNGLVKLNPLNLNIASGQCASSNYKTAVKFNGPYVSDNGELNYYVQLGGAGAGGYGVIQYPSMNNGVLNIDSWISPSLNINDKNGIYILSQSQIRKNNLKRYIPLSLKYIYSLSITTTFYPGSNGQLFVCYSGVAPMPFPYPTSTYNFNSELVLSIPSPDNSSYSICTIDNNAFFLASSNTYLYLYSKFFNTSQLFLSTNLVMIPQTSFIFNNFIFNVTAHGLISSDTGLNLNDLHYTSNTLYPNNNDISIYGPTIPITNQIDSSHYLINFNRPISVIGAYKT